MVTEDGTSMSRQEFQDLVEQRRQEKKAAKKTSSQFSIDQLLEKVRLPVHSLMVSYLGRLVD